MRFPALMPPVLAVALILPAIWPPPALGAQEASTAADAAALYEEKCTLCHEDKREVAAGKDRAEWHRTVSKMQEYASGLITDEEAAAIIDFLSGKESK